MDGDTEVVFPDRKVYKVLLEPWPNFGIMYCDGIGGMMQKEWSERNLNEIGTPKDGGR